MSHREFTHLLTSLSTLSPEQRYRLRRELDSKMAARTSGKAKRPVTRAEESVFDVVERSGLIGCLKGLSHSPSDLGTNSRHMEGFGRD